MKLPRRNFLHLAAGAAALPTASRFAWAQAYPSRPVHLIAPFAPGGAFAWRSTLFSCPIAPNWVRSSSGCGTDDCGRTSATSRPSMTPSPPSTGPSDARGRRSSAFVRERHAPIDARGRPALSRSAGCVLSDPPGATWETTHGPGMGCRTSSFPFGPEWERHSCRGRSACRRFRAVGAAGRAKGHGTAPDRSEL